MGTGEDMDKVGHAGVIRALHGHLCSWCQWNPSACFHAKLMARWCQRGHSNKVSSLGYLSPALLTSPFRACIISRDISGSSSTLAIKCYYRETASIANLCQVYLQEIYPEWHTQYDGTPLPPPLQRWTLRWRISFKTLETTTSSSSDTFILRRETQV